MAAHVPVAPVKYQRLWSQRSPTLSIPS